VAERNYDSSALWLQYSRMIICLWQHYSLNMSKHIIVSHLQGNHSWHAPLTCRCMLMTLRVSEKRLKVNVISSQSEGIIILINFFLFREPDETLLLEHWQVRCFWCEHRSVNPPCVDSKFMLSKYLSLMHWDLDEGFHSDFSDIVCYYSEQFLNRGEENFNLLHSWSQLLSVLWFSAHFGLQRKTLLTSIMVVFHKRHKVNAVKKTAHVLRKALEKSTSKSQEGRSMRGLIALENVHT